MILDNVDWLVCVFCLVVLWRPFVDKLYERDALRL